MTDQTPPAPEFDPTEPPVAHDGTAGWEQVAAAPGGEAPVPEAFAEPAVPPVAPPTWPAEPVAAPAYTPPPTYPAPAEYPAAYPPPAYPAPAYPAQYAAAPAGPQTSSNAVVALILAIVSWAVCPIIPAIVALVLASSAAKEIAASGGRIQGSGLVTAARIVSWINIGVWAAVLVVGAFFFVLAIVAGGVNDTNF